LDKSPDAFRTISEAADELNLPQHVLRFWETRFATIKPLKRGGGRRYYRPEDVLLLKGIRHLLYDQGFTIKGVQRILKDRGVRYVIAIGEGKPIEALPPPEEDFEADDDAMDVADGALETPVTKPKRRLFQPAAAMSAADRDRLEGVLRELLDCKRLLDRAREL
jgi:DNA-binding transcriptional MerR regulator